MWGKKWSGGNTSRFEKCSGDWREGRLPIFLCEDRTPPALQVITQPCHLQTWTGAGKVILTCFSSCFSIFISVGQSSGWSFYVNLEMGIIFASKKKFEPKKFWEASVRHIFEKCCPCPPPEAARGEVQEMQVEGGEHGHNVDNVLDNWFWALGITDRLGEEDDKSLTGIEASLSLAKPRLALSWHYYYLQHRRKHDKNEEGVGDVQWSCMCTWEGKSLRWWQTWCW